MWNSFKHFAKWSSGIFALLFFMQLFSGCGTLLIAEHKAVVEDAEKIVIHCKVKQRTWYDLKPYIAHGLVYNFANDIIPIRWSTTAHCGDLMKNHQRLKTLWDEMGRSNYENKTPN